MKKIVSIITVLFVTSCLFAETAVYKVSHNEYEAHYDTLEDRQIIMQWIDSYKGIITMIDDDTNYICFRIDNYERR